MFPSRSGPCPGPTDEDLEPGPSPPNSPSQITPMRDRLNRLVLDADVRSCHLPQLRISEYLLFPKIILRIRTSSPTYPPSAETAPPSVGRMRSRSLFSLPNPVSGRGAKIRHRGGRHRSRVAGSIDLM